MSLTLTSKIKTAEGIELENTYARVLVIDNINGNKLDCALKLYASKEAYENGLQPLKVDFKEYVSNPYDRSLGVDILNLAHDNLIQHLAEQNITATKNL